MLLGLAVVASAAPRTPAAQVREGSTASRPPAGQVREAVPNDNRVAAGAHAAGVLSVALEAELAAWRPDLDVDSSVTVQAFSEAGGSPRIPAPLVRASSGTEVRITVRNGIPDSTLVVHGLRAGTQAGDTIVVPPGATREVRYRAGAPGTYLYWGTTSGRDSIGVRQGRDGQLTGAIVIDAADRAPDPRERIFVVTVIDIVPDTTKPPPHEDIWELAINGRAWPHSEALEYGVGDTIRWRWLNGSYLPHPMHLHGFHFRVLATGDGTSERKIPPDEVRHVVTEFMVPGSTMAMEWVPTRAGSWLFHCHMAAHISPYPKRPDSVRAHDEHDVVQHAKYGMAGLVLGIRTVDRRAAAVATPAPPARRLRLYAQERTGEHGTAHGYVLQEGDVPAPDSIHAPGPLLLLARGETTAITVVNRTREHTTVHWHGMELESVYDGVAGWSATAGSIAPLILPGDSFTVAFTPPRAGTYIYHTHMDESKQLATGMYGAMVVLEPGERFDPERDVVLVVGRAIDGARHAPALNGRREPPPLAVRAGTTYRIRFVNILPVPAVTLRLVQDSALLQWRPMSKDGADLPAALRTPVPARTARIGVGETYDFAWTPERTGTAELIVHQPRERWTLSQRFEVRARD